MNLYLQKLTMDKLWNETYGILTSPYFFSFDFSSELKL